MFFDFDVKSALLLVFFIHGIVFSILLWIKGKEDDDKPSIWLSVFTILCALYISPFMLGYAGWYSKANYRDILFYVPFQQLFLLPPLFYYYFRTLLDKSFIFSKREIIHFLPAMLYLLYSVVIFITDKIVLKEYYFYQDGKDKDLSTWYQVSGFISLTFYLVLSLKIYIKYKKITYNTLSFADSLRFNWAKRFLLAFLLLLTVRGLFFIINPEWGEFGKKFWYYLCFSILFYYISISGYVNSIRSVTSFKNLKSDQEPIKSLGDNLNLTAEKNEIQDLTLWKEKIENLMLVDKLYENPELTIAHLCNKTGTHSKKISQVINQGFEMNFNDFVNHYRIKAVINKMEKGEHYTITLLGIAFDCGFNSKSTFNRSFKRNTKLSPKEYIEKHFQK
ncbi:MAG: hypothetical protein RL705_316 [Bacteroidota bacterium]|jgi:AraC-like DNA-binding protein